MALSLKCSDMGGPCDEVITGETKEELMANAMKHVEEKHPEMVPDIKAMSAEEMAEWTKTHVDAKLAEQAMPDEGPATPAEEEGEKEIEMI